jgi:bla regulator protein BlaR1
LGLSAAAVLAERALIAGRGPVRLVWIGAVALSLLLPAVAFRFAQRPVVPPSAASLVPDVSSDRTDEIAAAPVMPISKAAHSSSAPRDWRMKLARYDEPLAIAWITLSLALTVNFLGGIVALVWMRRGWKRRDVQGVPVYVSASTGPAVVGAVSPAIVIPQWVLALEPSQLALMLRHEEEHRRAGDGRLLTVAELALIAMPWNIALWWQILRLRAAVELDCDARVLQHADARSYGDLLLEMARPRRVLQLSGATAFAERATQLERRIRVLGRHRVRTSRAARALATSIGLAAVSLAWVAPRPLAPARVSAATAPDALAATPVQTALPQPIVPSTGNAKQPNVASVDSKTPNTAPSRAQPKRVEIPARSRDTACSAQPVWHRGGRSCCRCC